MAGVRIGLCCVSAPPPLFASHMIDLVSAKSLAFVLCALIDAYHRLFSSFSKAKEGKRPMPFVVSLRKYDMINTSPIVGNRADLL